MQKSSADFRDGNEDSPEIDRNGIGFHELDIPVDPAALILPSFIGFRIDMHREDIFHVEAGKIGDIHLEGDISAVVVLQKASVQIDIGNPRDPFEENGQAFVPILFGKRKMLAVPCRMITEKAQRGRFLRIGGLADDLIMQKIDILPVFLRKFTVKRPTVRNIVVLISSRTVFQPFRFCGKISSRLCFDIQIFRRIGKKSPISVKRNNFSHE